MTVQTHSRALRATLPDHANESDHRALPIDRVGIRGLKYPINVLDKNHRIQTTVADLGLYVGLPASVKGTHMSRFIEVLNTVRDELTIRNMPSVLERIRRHLQADSAYLDADFPYFIEKKAPVSEARSLMAYDCRFSASLVQGNTDFVLGVDIPVKSLCPCSKAISERGAHNQRSIIQVRLRATDFVWIEEIVEVVESCASAPVYALLKREDEKFVTEQAYDNPKFAEDLVRDVILALRDLSGVHWVKVSVENHESIHNHQAYAEISWSGSQVDESPLERQRMTTSEEPAMLFGDWLRMLRSQRKLSQSALADRCGMTASYLSRVESGDRQPGNDHVRALASALGVDPIDAQLRAGIIPTGIMAAIQRDPQRLRHAFSNTAGDVCDGSTPQP